MSRVSFAISVIVVATCMAGAVGYNIGQLLAAWLLLQSESIFFYLPILLLAGIPSGLFTGYVLKYLLEESEKSGVLNGRLRT